MLVAQQLEEPWQQDVARIVGLLLGLIASLRSGLELWGSAGSREAMEKLLAGVDRLEAGQDRLLAGQDRLLAGQDKLLAGQDKLLAGQDKTNALLKEILDAIKSDKADDGAKSGSGA